MLYDLSKYEKHLVFTENGIELTKDAPQNIRERIEQINKEYKGNYGETLIYVPH